MRPQRVFQVILLSVIFLAGTARSAGEQAVSDENLDRLIAELSLEEKALLTSGRDAWSTQPIERLDIPIRHNTLR